ncbi:uncharacterized protein FIBRA_00311 [Fibroporia radiculosa]|uniref:F-box domain-containing protein n=1 Tax=Fibroporia radiculosa TaxID=599839 RepID=J7RGV6_9APHY|nr:uncharacterized protein FIBRA_00311 [Fibroporia radiculosa]CCL98317.1 predicted protein [Fibroporia radiculosa]
MSINLCSLNDDVLAYIVSFLATQDAVRLSLSSRRIYPTARRHSLSTISIHNPVALSRVAAYMLEDASNRLCFVREFRATENAFPIESIKPEDGFDSYFWTHGYQRDHSGAHAIADLLESAPNIRYIHLEDVEWMIKTEPRLGRALAALPALSHVYLYGVGSTSLRFLAQMNSTPCILVLQHRFEWSFKRKDLFPFAHSHSLRRLQEIELASFKHGSTAIPNHGFQLPIVYRLKLTDCHVPSSAIVRMFPNVRELSLCNVVVTSEDGSEVCWPKLDRADGRLLDFSIWNVTSRVRFLRLSLLSIDDPIEENSNGEIYTETIARIVGVVHNTCPVILDITVHGIKYHHWIKWADVIYAAPSLRCLILEMDIKDCSSSLTWIGTFVEAISHSDIISVQLRVAICGSETSYTINQTVEQWTPSYASHRLKTQYISIVSTHPMKDENDSGTTLVAPAQIWWRISGSGEDRVVRKISSEIGERLHAYVMSPAFDPSAPFNGIFFMSINAGILITSGV